MKEILNAAIIGCGMIGRGKHAGTITAQRDMKLVALCDIIPERAHELAAMHNLTDAAIFQDYREMISDESLDIDIVYVCTPNPLHCEMAVAALEAGKHVFVEKPLACTKAECDAIIAAARSAGRQVSVGFQRRFFPAHLLAKDVVESGELGEIYYAKCHGIRYRGTPGWGEYLTGKNGGGVFIDGVPHSLDITLWLMNNYEPKSVKANLYDKMKMATEGNMWGCTWTEEDFKVEDSGFALVTMKNGATIMMECAWAINLLSYDMKATLCGTRAGLDMQGGLATTDYIRLNGTRHGGTFVEELHPTVLLTGGIMNVNEDSYFKENRNWIHACRNNGEGLLVTPEQAAVVTQIIEGIYESARTGKEVFFD